MAAVLKSNGVRLALDAGNGVTRHVMVGFPDPADGHQAEAAALPEATATTGRAAATAAGPLRSMARAWRWMRATG
jgi:hypothetical protein